MRLLQFKAEEPLSACWLVSEWQTRFLIENRLGRLGPTSGRRGIGDFSEPVAASICSGEQSLSESAIASKRAAKSAACLSVDYSATDLEQLSEPVGLLARCPQFLAVLARGEFFAGWPYLLQLRSPSAAARYLVQVIENLRRQLSFAGWGEVDAGLFPAANVAACAASLAEHQSAVVAVSRLGIGEPEKISAGMGAAVRRLAKAMSDVAKAGWKDTPAAADWQTKIEPLTRHLAGVFALTGVLGLDARSAEPERSCECSKKAAGKKAAGDTDIDAGNIDVSQVEHCAGNPPRRESAESLLRCDAGDLGTAEVVDALWQLANSTQRAQADQRREVEKAKRQAVKELAYGLSHEINNPLGNIASRAEALARQASSPNLQQALATIFQQAMRAHHMIGDLMYFANPPRPDIKRVELGALLSEACVRSRRDTAGCPELSEQSRPEVMIEADAGMICELFRALLKNSCEAATGDQPVAATARVCVDWSVDAQRWVVIDWKDEPLARIDRRIREHMFDPYFSGREAGRGLGFGLTKARRIAELHGGTLEWVDAAASGRFVLGWLRLRLPIAGERTWERV